MVTSSETLAAREIVETYVASSYSAGDILSVSSTAGIAAGDTLVVTNGTASQKVVISGVGPGVGLAASDLRFVTQSGSSKGLANAYAVGSAVKLLHEVDTADPVSAIITIDQLYRFEIDSLVNQIHFG